MAEVSERLTTEAWGNTHVEGKTPTENPCALTFCLFSSDLEPGGTDFQFRSAIHLSKYPEEMTTWSTSLALSCSMKLISSSSTFFDDHRTVQVDLDL